MALVLLVVGSALAACGASAPLPTMETNQAPPEPAATLPEPPSDLDEFLTAYAETGRYRLGYPTNISIPEEGKSILFLRSGPRSFSRNLYSLDLASGHENVFLTADALLGGAEEKLSDEERARRERLRLAAKGITSYELSRDGRRILVPLSGRLFIYERESGEITELTADGGYANDAHFSPDGTKVACVRAGNLFIIDVDRNRQKQLTEGAEAAVSYGIPEFVAQEEMSRYRGYWWAPDSKALVVQRTDESAVEALYSADPMFPEQPPHAARFPRAGTTNADVELMLVRVTGGPLRPIAWDREAFPYLAEVRWREGAPLTLLVQNRAQTKELLLAVDPARGTTTTLLEEQDEAWLNLDHGLPRWIRKGEQFLWSSERSGYAQLELRDDKGELVRVLTPKELGYSELLHVDDKNRFAWVLGSAEPTEMHVYRVPLDEGEPERITRERGLHSAAFGHHPDLWVHTSHDLEGEIVHTIRRGPTEKLGELRSLAEEPLIEPQVELVTVGPLDYRAAVIRPRSFIPGRKYPVLVSVYGGPGHREVVAAGQYYLIEQWLADHGFIVVSIDGRGTPGRGREWERAIKGNVIDIPLTDQVTGLKALGERFDELDLGRVGIYGWSFGGYFAAMAVMREGEVFHAAVAGAPVSDWHDYDTHYTERYLGLPSENEAGYKASSVLTYADELERPLLIVHGTSDDNVYFTHAVKLSDALLRAGKRHDFLPLSGFTHMVADPETTLALNNYIADFLRTHLSP